MFWNESARRCALLSAVVALLAVFAADGALRQTGRAVAASCGPGPCLRVDALPGGGIDETATVGWEADVDIVLEDAGDIGAFNFVLIYDRAVATADPPSTAGLGTSSMDCSLPPSSGALPEDSMSADHSAATGDAFISCFSATGVPGGGVIARVHLRAVAPGTTQLTLAQVAVGSLNGTELVSCNPVIDQPGGGCTNAGLTMLGGTGAPPPAPTPGPPPPQSGGTCAVTSAIDGETVQCADGSRVRFAGVASPLGADPGAGWATAVTQWFLAGKPISIETDVSATDEFGSRYGYPHVTGADGADYNISVLLIYVGMAHHVSDGVNVRYNDWLAASQVWARTACWNMWAAGNPFAAESGCG